MPIGVGFLANAIDVDVALSSNQDAYIPPIRLTRIFYPDGHHSSFALKIGYLVDARFHRRDDGY
jgi:hypothetical protein